MLVAGAAAALLISASPAHAGVKFEKVQTKKVKTRATWSPTHGACQPVISWTCIPGSVGNLPKVSVSSHLDRKTSSMQLFQPSGAPAAVKAPQVPEVKLPGEPLKLPSFGIDAGSIALPGQPLHPWRYFHHPPRQVDHKVCCAQ